MQIKQPEHITFAHQLRLFLKKRKRGLVVSLALIIMMAVVVGGGVASKILKTKGYTGLPDFLSTVVSNYWNSRNTNPENISIEIKEKDLKKLEKNRAKALERGVIINELDGDYVPATLEYQHKKITVKLRLKGHMTDHLEENKWSFRIKVKDKNSFMGMKRFSIQHPGTRGYIYEWLYHELMRKENIIALRYKFINVTVNGKDWGIYAIEENFDQELLTNNNRKKGPIIRFNPDLYWVDRLNELNRVKPVAEFASFYSANPEAYREEEILKDSLQSQYYLKALALMEGFRAGKIKVEEAFDISHLAKFNALIDLVGGQHSIDWSDIKYYYNPVTAKLEPVAYESFTVFPFESIAGNYRYVASDSSKRFEDLHTALFSDSTFFKAYVKELERISNPTYLDTFFKTVDSSLQSNLAILYKEFPYKKFEKEGYYSNQKMIKKILDAPKSFHAYYKSCSYDSICIQLGAIESLPIAIKSLQTAKGEVFYPTQPIVLPAKQPNTYVEYKDYYFKWPHATAVKDLKDPIYTYMWEKMSFKINYSILGSSQIKQETVFDFPHTDVEFIKEDLKNKKSTLDNFSFLIKDEQQKIITIQPGKHVISSDLIIPAGYKVFASDNSSLDLINKAKIITYSPLFFSGTDDEYYLIESSDLTGQGIGLINAPGSVFNNVLFKDMPTILDKQWRRSGYITCYESKITLEHCHFNNGKAKSVLNLIHSDYTINECLFQDIMNDALDIDFSQGTIAHTAFENNGKAINSTMSKMDLTSISISGAKDKAIVLKEASQLSAEALQIKNSTNGIWAENNTTVYIQNSTISNVDTGIFVSGEEAFVTTNVLKFEKVGRPCEVSTSSHVKINGKAIDPIK